MNRSSHTQLQLTHAQWGFAVAVGSHAAPTETQSFVRGQQTSVFVAQGCVSLQKTPGSVGVRQCFASGQQYEF
jgi:hypothetical protein